MSPSNSGLISFRIDWFDLAVWGTLKGLPQYHNLKASVLQCLASFMVQLSHLYMTTGKTIVLTIWTFVGKVMWMFVIAFLPWRKCLNFMAAVTVHSDFGAHENKIYHCLLFFPFICYEVMGPDAMILGFWMLSFKPAFSLSSFTHINSLFPFCH